jgi:hypothetical protein
MLICRNCGNSGRDMFGNVCPCQKRRMKGQAMYAVFYRLGGYEETWRQVPDDLIGSYSLAAPIAQTVQAALRHIGYPFAQAEARKLTNAATELALEGDAMIYAVWFSHQARRLAAVANDAICDTASAASACNACLAVTG